MHNVPWPTLLAGSIVTTVIGTLAYTVRAILTGQLVTRKQAEFWQRLYEQEQAEHEKTREAMLALVTTDRAGIEAARLAADVMQGIKAQAAVEPPA